MSHDRLDRTHLPIRDLRRVGLTPDEATGGVRWAEIDPRDHLITADVRFRQAMARQ